jgi:hypothetical protein
VSSTTVDRLCVVALPAPSFRIFAVAETGVLTLNGVTISGGKAFSDDCHVAPGAFACGGGIANLGTLHVTSSRVLNDVVSSGVYAQGGGFENNGTATITGSDIVGNAAPTSCRSTFRCPASACFPSMPTCCSPRSRC